jgi:hypothetical protein
VIVVAALPLFMMTALLGGISYGQIFRVFGVTIMATLVAGSLGCLVAFWREKTFQSLAVTLLILVLWMMAWEVVATGALGPTLFGVSAHHLAEAMSPWQAMQVAAQPQWKDPGAGAIGGHADQFLIFATFVTVVLNTIAIGLLRVWNPGREVRGQAGEDEETHALSAGADRAVKTESRAALRRVWDNPILWREVRTWAYGRKVLVVHVAYLILFAGCVVALVTDSGQVGRSGTGVASIPAEAKILAPLVVVSLILLNALSVTSLTNERDTKSLDLLLVSDLTPNEIVYGKLGGALYNAKEMVVLPMVLCAYLWFLGRFTTENFVFSLIGLGVLNAFAVVLGLHAGMTYANSRTAIATSIGTLMFLFLGVATCMRIMLSFSNSFQYQLGPFMLLTVGGGAAMYFALGWRNRSTAIGIASGITPFAMFFVMTSYLLGDYGTVFLVTTAAYSFATAAMLVPAVSEFDVATGRTIAQPE